MGQGYDKTLLSPPGKPGIDETNTTQVRLVLEQKDQTIRLLQDQKQAGIDRIARILTELHPFNEIAFSLSQKKGSPHKLIEESLLELAHLFATKYPEEDHPIVINLLRMVVKEVEDKLRTKAEDEPIEPSGSNC